DAFGRQAEARLDASGPEQATCRIAADITAVLETMARASAHQKNGGPVRMEVDEEFAVRTVLILADLCADQRRIPEQRETAVAKRDNLCQGSLGRAATLRIGIDNLPMGVMGELDPASLQVREAVEDIAAVEIRPAGHGGRLEPRVAGGRGEIEHPPGGAGGRGGRRVG